MKYNDILKSIGNNIKQARKMTKLKQTDLAKQIHVTPTYISALENGRKEPSIKLLWKINKVTEMPMHMLLNI